MESQVNSDISSLPPEAQKQIRDFVAFMKAHYASASKSKAKGGMLSEEPQDFSHFLMFRLPAVLCGCQISLRPGRALNHPAIPTPYLKRK
jgi:hypothetical protein